MKKITAILVLAMLAMSMTACGDSESSSSESSSEAITTEAPTEAEATEEASEEVTEDAAAPEVSEDEPAQTPADNGLTAGQQLLSTFNKTIEDDPVSNCQQLADAVLCDPIINFMAMTVSVEPGMLTGFGNAEITGFKEGIMFAPAIGAIPFVGYVFQLEDGTDADEFIATLKDNADPRWNICTEAEETVVDKAEDKVFFVMCTKSLEE